MASPASIRPLVAGNWKMNGLAAALGEARRVRDRLGEADYAAADAMICPPATLVAALAKEAAGSRLKVGAQDCHAAASGAHTGDISAEMLKDAGADGGDRRPLGAARGPWRGRPRGAPEGAGCASRRSGGHRLRRRDGRSAPGRTDARRGGAAAGGLAARQGDGARYRHRLRAGVGDRHGADRQAVRRGRGARLRAPGARPSASARRAPPCASCTAAR